MQINDKNRPDWRIRLKSSGSKLATFKGYQSRFGDGVGRGQCIAIARSTGTRCKNDPMQGSTSCRVHGGHMHAYRAHGVAVSSATARVPRKALAAIGGMVPDGFPLDVPLSLSPVERGRLFEAWRNRKLAPTEWKRLKLSQLAREK